MRHILNYQSIAKVIKQPVTTVIELVKFAIQSYYYNFEIHPPSWSKFAKQHIGCLASQSTLQESAHLSLAERAQLFHRRFDKKKIRQPLSVAFTWSTKSSLKTSNEVWERSTSPNRITAIFSIVCSNSCNKCVNQTLRWYISMNFWSFSAFSEWKDGCTKETEFASTIRNRELPL